MPNETYKMFRKKWILQSHITVCLVFTEFKPAFRWWWGISPQWTFNVKRDKDKSKSFLSCCFDLFLKEDILTSARKYQLGMNTYLIWPMWITILSEAPRSKNMGQPLKYTSESLPHCTDGETEVWRCLMTFLDQRAGEGWNGESK